MVNTNDLIPLGVFTQKEALETLSISQPSFYRLVKKSGVIKTVERGYYIHSHAEIKDEHLDFIVACKKFGEQSVIGGITALEFYNLTELVAPQIWVLIPPNKRVSNHSKYKTIKTTTPLDVGIVNADGFRIVSLERALIEGLKYHTKIGESTGIKAILEALKNNQTTEGAIFKMAKKLDLLSYINKKWEMITAYE
jgi:predicted transcriptional regulator of viral defense system